MNRRIMLAAAGLAAAAASTSALAQETKPIGLSVRAGMFFPSSEASRDEGATWLAAGVEFRLQDLNFGMAQPGMSNYLSLSADYMGAGDFRSVPVLVNFVQRNNEFYWTAGAGWTFGRHMSGGSLEDRNTFAFALGLGWDFSKGSTPFFIEGRYYGGSEGDFTGFGAFVGVRL